MSTKPEQNTAVFPNELENREGEVVAIEHGERSPAPFPGSRPDAFDVDPPEEREEETTDEDDEEDS